MDKEKQRDDYINRLMEIENFFKNTAHYKKYQEVQGLVLGAETCQQIGEEQEEENKERLSELEEYFKNRLNKEQSSLYKEMKKIYKDFVRIGIVEDYDLSEED